tara:strand:+ start:580 stop:1473 length:894 start_codon:yes stop_codon:yes gene_type:complete
MIILLVGFGSIGQRHYKILKKLKFLKSTYVLSKQKLPPNIQKCSDLSEVRKINPDYVIIASPTNLHYQQLNYINNVLKNKKILVEKPIFHSLIKLKKLNNKIYVGYNLRFHPIIKKIKELVKNKRIFSINSICFSNLKNWRKRKYYLTSSAKKNSGGVVFDLSHEFDFISWIFGNDMKVKNYVKKKNSLLKIETEDYLSLNAVIKKKIQVNINLNYYSKITNRKIFVDGNKFSIECDLINNHLIYKSDNKIKKYYYKNFHRDDTFLEMHKKILNDETNELCDYFDGLKLMKFMNKIK